MKRHTLHLISNAHIDPVWQWEWEEGAAAAVSTFRAAADFCEQFEGYVFNHNEALLYEWVREYEPSLFERIRTLVGEGKWHIMGGWYLQPDCNLSSGESLVRQIVLGREYFRRQFGARPTTAINFDSFGHSRGLVQILCKSGFDSYLFCRPGQDELELEGEDFVWVGYDGSEIPAHRAFDYYNTELGGTLRKITKWLNRHPGKSPGLLLWGVGNHGGGPSRIDLAHIAKLAAENAEFDIIHSTPEAYFRDLLPAKAGLPRRCQDLNPHAVGCYISQVRIKQKHRQLENELYATEKMLSSAALQQYIAYPEEELREALHDLMVAEFHDILPGSSVQPVEEAALRLIDHGLERVSRLKARAFFALAAGQRKAEEGEYPILIYNPHPFPVEGIFEGEFQLPDAKLEGASLPDAFAGGTRIPCQLEKELGNMKMDWRKRVAFRAVLEPSRMNRVDCRLTAAERKPEPGLRAEDGKLKFRTDELAVVVNANTGWIDRYAARGVDYLKEGSFRPIAIEDSDNPWAHDVRAFGRTGEPFRLLDDHAGSSFSGIRGQTIGSVRVVEDGDVRTVVEAVFGCGHSFICQQYKLPKSGTELEIETRVYWNEKSKLLKLSVPTLLQDVRFLGQDAFGIAELPAGGEETAAHRWVGVFADAENKAFTCLNDGIYGSDCLDGEIRLSLLRSPAYTAYAANNDPDILVKDRFIPRIDQGERIFRFRMNGGEAADRLERVDREAAVFNEKPFVLSFFPSGEGVRPLPLIVLDDACVQLSAFKKAEDGEDYIFRLYEPTGRARQVTAKLPAAELELRTKLKPFEVKTFRLSRQGRTVTEVNLIEEQPGNRCVPASNTVKPIA